MAATRVRAGVLKLLIRRIFLVLLFVSCSPAQSNDTPSQGETNSPTAAAAPPITARGWLVVSFPKSLHAKKLKEGDPVEANPVGSIENEAGQTVALLPPATKVLGTVTEVKLSSRGDKFSTLGIVFEKIRLADGRELPFKGVIYHVTETLPPLSISGANLVNSPAWAGSSERMLCSSGGPQPTTVPCSMSQPTVSDSARESDLLREGSAFDRPLQIAQPRLAVIRPGVVSSRQKEVVLETNVQLTLGFIMSAAH